MKRHKIQYKMDPVKNVPTQLAQIFFLEILDAHLVLFSPLVMGLLCMGQVQLELCCPNVQIPIYNSAQRDLYDILVPVDVGNAYWER